MSVDAKLDYAGLDDAALARLIAQRDADAVRLITGRNNQRLFRTAFSILKNRSEAEDAVQTAYVNAIAAVDTFEARSSLTTWLTRIVINEALGRKRAAERRRRSLGSAPVTVLEEYRDKLMQGSMTGSAPDGEVARGQLRALLETAIASLPDAFRLVFVLREIEELSIEDTAEVLGIPPATVKTRHLRARRRLQQSLAPEVKAALSGTFPFAGLACEALTERVVAGICGTVHTRRTK